MKVAVLLLYVRDEVHCCTRCDARFPPNTRTEKVGDSNIADNIIDALGRICL